MPPKLYHNGLTLRNSIVNIEGSIKMTLAKLNDLTTEKRQLEEELAEKNNEIQLQLQLSDVTNSRDIINSFNSANQDADKYNRLIGEKERDLRIKKEELASISSRLDEISEVPEYLKTKKNILQDLKDLSERTKQKKYEELIQLLENKTNEHYKNINAPTGAFYGQVRFDGDIEHGYRPIIIDQNNRDVTGTLNTSQLSSMKISIIMAVMSANRNRDYNTFYPLIADAPVSDFDDVKTATFLKETANTFGQSIVIVKEMLEKDPNRVSRYMPHYTRLRALENDITTIGKSVHVFQLDIPDGISKNNRNEIEIKISKIQL